MFERVLRLPTGHEGHAAPPYSESRPGSRAPHVWLERDGERISTLDLFGRSWVLLAAGNGWSAPDGVAVHVVPAQVADAYGIGTGGASLVRQDGIVAWRSREPGADVAAVLDGLLGR